MSIASSFTSSTESNKAVELYAKFSFSFGRVTSLKNEIVDFNRKLNSVKLAKILTE